MADEGGPTRSLLVLVLAGEYYGLPSASIREVVRYRPWTPVPGTPPTLPGIISQRGVILPVVELRALLGLPEPVLGRAARFVVVQHGDIAMALLAEVVLDLANVPEITIEPPPTGVDQRRAHFIHAIATFEERPLALLDVDALLTALREGT